MVQDQILTEDLNQSLVRIGQTVENMRQKIEPLYIALGKHFNIDTGLYTNLFYDLFITLKLKRFSF